MLIYEEKNKFNGKYGIIFDCYNYFSSIYLVKANPPKYIIRQLNSNNTILPVGLKCNNSLNSKLK